MKPADQKIADILARHGETFQESVWRVQGTAVIYHKALERIAAKAEIAFDLPTIVRAERDEAVMLVTGRMGERVEWSVGEALIGANYRVSGKQAAYVYAMAEKRAKDRVILKLIELSGLVYSEEEADDFKRRNADDEPPEAASMSASELMAEGMIEALMKRAGPAAIEAFLARDHVKRDLGLMEIEDHTRVMGVAAERRAVAPAAQAERAA